ncbi:hypothetical protein BLNAU_23264 [Blattamonas nauphoetae]|uniref:Uncharacterized protein n=1 Tax=Blattamonas nauphoetae TaxID=2049346 RepID=A0ABQ9WQP9_9EUKA|nr:hypothetical protein BLNAU_23264 [Blattamonas nauphoetae]
MFIDYRPTVERLKSPSSSPLAALASRTTPFEPRSSRTDPSAILQLDDELKEEPTLIVVLLTASFISFVVFTRLSSGQQPTHITCVSSLALNNQSCGRLSTKISELGLVHFLHLPHFSFPLPSATDAPLLHPSTQRDADERKVEWNEGDGREKKNRLVRNERVDRAQIGQL